MSEYNDNTFSSKGFTRLNSYDDITNTTSNFSTKKTSSGLMTVLVLIISIINITAIIYGYEKLSSQQAILENLQQENKQTQEKIAELSSTNKQQITAELKTINTKVQDINKLHKNNKAVIDKHKAQLTKLDKSTQEIKTQAKTITNNAQQIKTQITDLETKLNKALIAIYENHDKAEDNNIKQSSIELKQITDQVTIIKSEIKTRFSQIENSIRELYR